jgi:endonuclease YncB( thermonuclease family)
MENPNGGIFELPETGYYNLETKRYVKRKPIGLTLFENIAGKAETIERYKILNHLNGSGSSSFCSETEDIDDLSTDQLERICQFSLCGLETKAKVLRVLDGDTVDLAFFCPVNFLRDKRFCLPVSESKGFFMRMITRIHGIDTPEHNTKEGIGAKHFLKKLVLGKTIRMKSQKFDKYGRLMASIFIDEGSVAELLIENSFALPYFGERKASQYKDLPKLSREEQIRLERILDS